MFYILCSHNIHALRRQFNTVPLDEATVIINSLDKKFVEEASAYCAENNIRYFITESDGTAATGKNSFLDRFNEDNIPYAVLIDGDDYLTKYGVKLYKAISESENPPDVVVLTNQHNINFNKEMVNAVSTIEERKDWDPSTLPAKVSPSSTVDDWELLAKGEMITDNFPDYTEEELDTFKKYIKNLQYGMGMDEISTRVVFMSRKVLPYRFKNFIVGEDTLQYLELKDAHEKGELVIKASKETKPTYMYDVRISGIALSESRKNYGRGFLEWTKLLQAELERLKEQGKLHNSRIELLE